MSYKRPLLVIVPPWWGDRLTKVGRSFDLGGTMKSGIGGTSCRKKDMNTLK